MAYLESISGKLTSVHSGAGAIRNIMLNIVPLELVLCEHVEKILLRHLQSFKLLLSLSNLRDKRLNGLPVGLMNRCTAGKSHVVVKAVFCRGTPRKKASVEQLAGLSKGMCALFTSGSAMTNPGSGIDTYRMPEDLLALRMVEVEDLKLAAGLEWTF
jgi:hypothetical protein